jgi:hypothetical protein
MRSRGGFARMRAGEDHYVTNMNRDENYFLLTSKNMFCRLGDCCDQSIKIIHARSGSSLFNRLNGEQV